MAQIALAAPLPAPDSHGITDYLRPTCYHRHDNLRQTSMGGKSFQAVPTVEQYMWEGNILDCSIGDAATTVLPSTFIQQAAGLSFDMRGPSWLNADRAPVFSYYEEPGNESRALLVRADFLEEFLAVQKLELVALQWFERMELSDTYDRKHPQVHSATEARVSANLTIHTGKARRREHDLA